MDDLINVCVRNMANEEFTEEQARSYMKELLPTLDYGMHYEELNRNRREESCAYSLQKEIILRKQL